MKRTFRFEQFSISVSKRAKSVLAHAILIPVALSCLFPLVWMVVSALKTQSTVFTDFSLFPADPQFHNFVRAWTQGKLSIYFLNSVLYTLTCVFFVLLISSLAAYAFARLEFPGKNVLYVVFLATLMIPVPGGIVALYVLIKNLGLYDTRWGYMLPLINGGLALGIFILRAFFERIPKELEDAARIDGCGRWGIYWHVALPLAKPALAVVALFTALNVWNEFIWASIILQNPHLMPLQQGLVRFWGGAIIDYPLLNAGMALSVLPIILAYIFLQRHIIAGVTAGALKG